MQYLFQAFLFYLIVTLIATSNVDEDCLNGGNDVCKRETEYNAYIRCKREHRRYKRSNNCPLVDPDCQHVNCHDCLNTCTPNCPECRDCGSSCRQCCSEVCDTNLCCHTTCHNQCKTNHCRAECKKECRERIGTEDSVSRTQLESKHNITTIINLRNVINNTNLIDIPIKINNTNYNNITLRREGDGFVQIGGERTSLIQRECCHVISPRHCNQTTNFPYVRCFRYRNWQCGSFCSAPVVYASEHQTCTDQRCRNSLSYIPEQQTRCQYQPTWPFVTCGRPKHCTGCYDHFGGISEDRCSQCYYNSGLGYNNPSCWQLGTCGYYPPYPMFPYPIFPFQTYPYPIIPMSNYQFRMFNADENDPVYDQPDLKTVLKPEITVNASHSNNRTSRYALISIDVNKKDKKTKGKNETLQDKYEGKTTRIKKDATQLTASDQTTVANDL